MSTGTSPASTGIYVVENKGTNILLTSPRPQNARSLNSGSSFFSGLSWTRSSLNSNDQLKYGDIISTDSNSTITLRSQQGSKIYLSPLTSIQILPNLMKLNGSNKVSPLILHLQGSLKYKGKKSVSELSIQSNEIQIKARKELILYSSAKYSQIINLKGYLEWDVLSKQRKKYLDLANKSFLLGDQKSLSNYMALIAKGVTQQFKKLPSYEGISYLGGVNKETFAELSNTSLPEARHNSKERYLLFLGPIRNTDLLSHLNMIGTKSIQKANKRTVKCGNTRVLNHKKLKLRTGYLQSNGTFANSKALNNSALSLGLEYLALPWLYMDIELASGTWDSQGMTDYFGEGSPENLSPNYWHILLGLGLEYSFKDRFSLSVGLAALKTNTLLLKYENNTSNVNRIFSIKIPDQILYRAKASLRIFRDLEGYLSLSQSETQPKVTAEELEDNFDPIINFSLIEIGISYSI